jgi:hydroxyethylthiazole kinase-like uncharacterized protein yjeF
MQTNHPDLWKSLFPAKKPEGHKYDSGHALIYGAPQLTGATRLAAESCARMGAGLTTVLAPKKIAPIYRAALPAHIMVRDDLKWSDARVTARLHGPGGLSAKPDFKSELPTVLDANALQNLPRTLGSQYVLTPHEGEFSSAFPSLAGLGVEKAMEASRFINAIVVLKGAKTVIVAPDGRAVINANSSPVLATAGTGDVLAGMIAGLLAQGMDPFGAACAAVWMHGEAGKRFGMGLVASDLPGLIPGILQDLA